MIDRLILIGVACLRPVERYHAWRWEARRRKGKFKR